MVMAIRCCNSPPHHTGMPNHITTFVTPLAWSHWCCSTSTSTSTNTMTNTNQQTIQVAAATSHPPQGCTTLGSGGASGGQTQQHLIQLPRSLLPPLWQLLQLLLLLLLLLQLKAWYGQVAGGRWYVARTQDCCVRVARQS